MGYKIQFETGHTVEFDSKPSDADIEEAYNSVKGTPATAAKPKLDPRALLQDTAKQAQDYSANMYSGLEGAATAVTGGVAPLLAPIPAAMQYANEKLKGNSPSFEDLYANAMHGMTYEPKSDLGKSQAEVIGKFANDVLIPAATGAQGLPFVNTLGAYAGAVGRNLGRVKPVAKATETPHPALAAIEAATKPAEVALDPQQAGAKAFQAINDRLGFQEGESSPMRPVADPMATMADTLVQRGEQERAANADAGIARREEIQTDAVNRQTALDLNAAERQRQENAPTGYEAIKAAEEKAKADAQAEMQKHQAAHEALVEEQRQLDASRATDEARAQAQEVINQRERQLQADVQRTVEQARKNAEEIANRRAASQTSSEAFNIRHERAIKESVENHPFLKAAEDKVDQLKVKLTALEDAVANGETNAVALVATRNALKNAIATRDKVLTNLTEQARSGVLPKSDRASVVSRAGKLFDEGDGVTHLRSGLTKEDFIRAMEKLAPYVHKATLDKLLSPPDYKSRNKLVLMTPKEFLDVALKFSRSGPDTKRLGTIKTLFKNGSKIDTGTQTIPWLTLGERKGAEFVTGHEGRHRATFFEEKGVPYIPVELRSDRIRWDQQAEKRLFDYIENYPEKIGTQDAYQMRQMYGDTRPLTPEMERAFPVSRENAGESGQFAHWDKNGVVKLNSGMEAPVEQLKKVAGIKDSIPQLFPMEKTAEQLVDHLKETGAKDVDQNIVQRGINHLTKGSLYQAIKTKNPVIQFVGEKFRAADNQIKRYTGEIVHDKLAPLAQDMTKHEKAVAWSLQTIAEQKGFELTPEFLRDPANKLNEKQIAWIEGQKEMSKAMLERINSVQATAGKAPISPRVAYLATRARGDFRKLVYDGFNPSGEPKVVGILGDNTRMGLNKQVEQLKAKHPEYTTGEERFYGGHNKKGTADGFEQLLEFLSENDPKMKDFVDRVNDLISDDAYNFMNAETHTMNKKGVFGMEGKKLFESASKNAEDGMAAQIRYAETIIRWSELSKAVDEVKPLIAKDNGVNMPNAKAWAEDYIQGALGNSPGEFGKHLDNATAALGKASGVGVTIPGQVMGAAKKIVNGQLLGFINNGFLAMNVIQPVKTMPEMAMWLKTNGVDVGVDLGLGRSLTTMHKELLGMELKPFEKEALKFAKENHVYSSSLFESGNRVSKDIPYYWDKGTQFIAKDVEAQTRKLTFLSYVHMLHESGVRAKDGLFEAAQNATDIHMNNYAQAEAPKIYQETGAVGRSAYNLMSFKHNELSRLAMFARQLPKDGRPLGVALLSQVLYAGMMGTILYHELDWFVQQVSKSLGTPTSLTKFLLDNPNISDFFKYGMGSTVGLDLTNRMGVQVTPGSLVDAVAPGASKIGTMAKAAYQAATQPNEYNAKNLVRELSPNSIQGVEDRVWFSGTNPMGEELSMNRSKVQANAVRNQTDKLWKTLGLTGVNESKQKTLDYENTRIDQVYKDKRKSIIDNTAKVLFTSGKIPSDFAQKYIAAQGDPNSLARELTAMAMEQKIDHPTLVKLRNAMSSSLTSQHKLLRELGKE